MERTIIYLAQCTLDRKLVYVGKTYQSFEKRIEQHKRDATNGDSSKFHKALVAKGLDNWDWKILETCPRENEIEIEKSHIKAMSALPVEPLNSTHGKKDDDIYL